MSGLFRCARRDKMEADSIAGTGAVLVDKGGGSLREETEAMGKVNF